MTARTAQLSAEHRAWLDARVASLRAEYAADDVLARRRAPHVLERRERRRARSRLEPLVDALGAAALALFLVAALIFILTI